MISLEEMEKFNIALYVERLCPKDQRISKQSGETLRNKCDQTLSLTL